jgi:hypothetical protein
MMEEIRNIALAAAAAAGFVFLVTETKSCQMNEGNRLADIYKAVIEQHCLMLKSGSNNAEPHVYCPEAKPAEVKFK